MDHPGGHMLLGLAMVTFGLGASSPVAAREQVPTPQDCAALAVAQGLAIADEAAGEHGQDGRNTARAKQIEPTITSATWVPAAGSVPEYCRVEGYITTGDKHEGFNRVRFAVNLPTHWNGRFVMLGDGGHDGSVSTSTARLPQGYATANSDMGHDGRAFPGATFAFNNRAREIDYGWRGTHVTTVAAKGLIKAYYARSPVFSYWEGCSTAPGCDRRESGRRHGDSAGQPADRLPVAPAADVRRAARRRRRE